MSGALVSVCVPTRNRASYLREALESILAQTYANLELVVCDNASTDGTAAVVESLSDGRIRYLRNEADLGVAGNWIRAISESTGPYCSILGDDDKWEPTFLESLVAPLEEDPRTDVSFCDHWIIDRTGQRLIAETNACSHRFKRASLTPGRHLPFLELALEHQAIPVAAAVVRRDRLIAAGALDRRAGLVIDYYLWARLALAGGGAFYRPSRLASVRRHPAAGSIASFREMWPDLQWVCADLSRGTLSPRDRRRVRKKWASAICWEMVALMAGRHWSAVPRRLRLAFANSPASARLSLAMFTLLAGLTLGTDRAWAQVVSRGGSRG